MNNEELLGFRPLARYGWGPTMKISEIAELMVASFRPLARYGWVPTIRKHLLRFLFSLFSAPREVWVVSYFW